MVKRGSPSRKYREGIRLPGSLGLIPFQIGKSQRRQPMYICLLYKDIFSLRKHGFFPLFEGRIWEASKNQAEKPVYQRFSGLISALCEVLIQIEIHFSGFPALMGENAGSGLNPAKSSLVDIEAWGLLQCKK
jgi:hypothetical protein